MPVPPESEVEEILFWKTLQSADVRRPRFVADADGMLKVIMFPAAVIVKSVPVVDVASVCVPPDWSWPAGPMDVMPEPLVESVVPSNVRPEPIASVLICDVPFPSKIPVSVVEPVPPFGTVSAVASVSAPVEEKEEVAEPPKYATVAESCVDDAAPLKSIKDVVADWPADGWVKASYERRPVLAMVKVG